MPVVRNTARDPSGAPRPFTIVHIVLMSDGKTAYAADGSIVGPIEMRADASGFWSQELYANASISPTGTRWRVTERFGGSESRHTILVPTTAGPHDLINLLDAPPGELPAAALTLHINDAAKHAGAATFIHNQLTPSGTWVVLHNLGRFPSVMVADSSGNVIIGEIRYDSSNQITLSFGFAFGGLAYLN